MEETPEERRKRLAEMLRNGEPISVTPTGKVVSPNDAKEAGHDNIVVPEGKLAVFAWE